MLGHEVPGGWLCHGSWGRSRVGCALGAGGGSVHSLGSILGPCGGSGRWGLTPSLAELLLGNKLAFWDGFRAWRWPNGHILSQQFLSGLAIHESFLKRYTGVPRWPLSWGSQRRQRVWGFCLPGVSAWLAFSLRPGSPDFLPSTPCHLLLLVALVSNFQQRVWWGGGGGSSVGVLLFF